MSEYSKCCELGRVAAQHDLAAFGTTRNIPFLVSKIRQAATDESGHGAGYLYTLAGKIAE